MDTIGMRERILEMAARLFVVRGYDGISMREIADACGMSKAGLYYHFKDKEDLFLAIMHDHLQELGYLLQEVENEPGGARVQISSFVRAIFTRLPAERRAIIRLASQEMSKIRPEARVEFDRRYQEQFVGRLAAILEQGMRVGELRAVDSLMLVWGLLGLMYPFFNNQAYISSSQQLEVLVDFLTKLFFDGAVLHGK